MQYNNNIPVGYKDSAVGIIPQEWEVKTLSECFHISAGRDLQKEFYSHQQIDNYIYPIFSNSLEDRGLYGYTSKPRHTAGCITITGRGMLGVAEYRETDFDAIVRLLVLRPKFEVKGKLIAEYINHKKPFYFESTGVPQLTAPQIANTSIPVPPMREQRKIAEILGVWDEAIEKQSRLIERLELRKRGLMQHLLTGRTRLSGFTTPWQKIKFKQIFEKKNITLGANNTALEVLSVTKEGIVSQKEYFNKDIASEDTSKYLLVEKGDLAMSGLNFWMGSCHILTKYDKGIISPAYKVFKVSKIYNLPFMIHFVQSHTFKYSLVGCSVIGASIVRRNLDKEMLGEWCYLTPSLPEQKAIAEVLTTADDEIATHRKKLDALRLQKRGLMQQLLTGKTRVKI